MAKRPERSENSRRRRHKRRVINRKRLLLSIFLVLIGGELVFVLLTSPTFAVKKIIVAENKTVSDGEVLRVLKIPRRANIFRVDKVAALREVRRNPVVENASMRRRIPSTLIVTITERQPIFTLESSGRLYEIDASGIPFRQDKALNQKLPVVSCGVPKRIVLGRSINDATFAAARECLLLVQAKKVFSGITITVDQKPEMCLNIRDDFQVKLGKPEQLARKLDIAEQVILQTPEFRKRGAYIDVTCPEAPAYKLKD